MPTGAVAAKVLSGLLGASLALSGLSYAGVPGVPNPAEAVLDVTTGADEAQVEDEQEEQEEAEQEGSEPEDEGEPQDADLPEEAKQGMATAAQKRAAAEAYTAAVRDWTECVQSNAQAQGNAETRKQGAFDPRDGCGEHPDPHGYGLSDKPEQASDDDEQETEEPEVPEDEGDESDEGESEASGGPPEDRPGGRPDHGPGGR